MVLLQGVLALLSRSLSGALNVVFGWAVIALFGHTGEREKTLLSGLVGAAAAWPLLVIGIAFPRVAAWVLAFVPLSKDIPPLALRITWFVLALAVPVTLGIVFAKRAPERAPESTKERPLWKGIARGVPLTLGIAGAFLMMLGIAPTLQVLSLFQKRRDQHLPLLTEANAYDEAGAAIQKVLVRKGVQVERQPAPWWLTAPSGLLRVMGGAAVARFAPERLLYLKGPAVAVALYPSEALLRGSPFMLARVHGLVSEAVLPVRALETTAPQAQELERRFKDIYRTAAAAGAAGPRPELDAEVKQTLARLCETDLNEDDWQILYRQALQTTRALEKKPQLLGADG